MSKLIGRLLVVLALGWAGSASAAYMSPVSVDGRDWLQPVDFVNTSWNDVAAVCDPLTGSCSGNLNGGSLDGWTWASLLDVTYLFNSFLPVGQQLTPPGSIDANYLPAATDFLLAGFVATETYFDPFTFDSFTAVNGLTRTSTQGGAYSGSVRNGDSIYVRDHFRAGVATVPIDTALDDSGHFFFRGPAFPAPVPGTLALFALGLAALVLRRKGKTA